MTRLELVDAPAETSKEVDGLAVAGTGGEDTRIDLSGLSATELKPATRPADAPKREGRSSAGALSRSYLLSVVRLEANGSSTIHFPSRGADVSDVSRHGQLRDSLEALSQAAVSDKAGDWLDAASTAKRDAIRLRNSAGFGRHASVLLMLADALTFTVPSDPTLKPNATDGLRRGLSILTDSYVSTETEKHLMMELLGQGWNIAPAFEDAGPVD